MVLDEERRAKMHQKHDTVCITNMGGKHREMTADMRKDTVACCFFSAVYSSQQHTSNQIVL